MQTIDKRRRWTLRDVIFLAIIAIFFGIIYQVWSYAYYALAATPLKPFANDLTLGVWIMAGPLAGVLLKKPGAGFLGEFLAATVEMLLFSSWGAADLITGITEGAGAELGFATTGYRNWGAVGLFFSTLWSTIITFAWDWFQSGYQDYRFSLLVVLLVIRFISIGFFAGILVDWIAKLVGQTGLMHNK
ncbi:ECF transporter S component [uncultured Limosilactobacillus sp.]|uniref:ECF transporter S component n=1 Tax=uncultured Limosilactobacillus sp. TaxID=2837629 RepID=UPI0025F9461D|nr:ECF transporter S component [uncultured Limosilactobacillus sp.]